jgi:hypothetical protein
MLLETAVFTIFISEATFAGLAEPLAFLDAAAY